MIAPDLHPALSDLIAGDCLFFETYEDRKLFARLVMDGYARCYCKWGGQEWVTITEKGREEYEALSQDAPTMPALRRTLSPGVSRTARLLPGDAADTAHRRR